MTRTSATPAFSILVSFIAIMLIGGAFIPRLAVRLQPSNTLPSLSVRYSWPGASPRLMEQEITAPLEGLFSTIRGVTKINSTSGIANGRISLSFDKKADMDAMRFEVASKIREAYPNLPQTSSYPIISAYATESEEQHLLTYTLNAPASPRIIQQYAEETIKPKLSHIEGLYQIRVYGATKMEWELEYDQETLLKLGIQRNTILSALNSYFQKEVIGLGYETDQAGEVTTPKSIILSNTSDDMTSWQDIPVMSIQGRVFRIRDLCTIRYKEQPPTGFYRINGNNTINMVFTAEKGANSLRVAEEIKENLARLEPDFPQGYVLIKSSDSTEFIRDELRKIAYRTIFSFTILLLFVLLISRQFRYLLIVLITLLANLLSAVILYYLFKVEINLYSLAGITVSLGIIIDNTIVMVDHIRTKKNRKVFLAILAATLTTIGALSVIRFFGEAVRLMLRDFSLVLIINLSISLLVALFLAPSLMELIPLKRRKVRQRLKQRRRVVVFSRSYCRMIAFSQRFRWVYVVVALLIFGLPVFMLPTTMEGDKWYHQLYRSTLASETYVQKIKPVADKVLGGTLRLFRQKVADRYYYRMPERTQIHVSASLPQGATLDQMNDLMMDLERYLTGREQIDQFQTTITGARNARVVVTFKSDFELGAFPFVLYSQLQDFTNQNTNADWTVHGIGQGFSNSLSERVGSQQITLYGYNFETLWGYAEKVLANVLSHQRVERGSIMSEQTWSRDPVSEYVIRMDPQKLFTQGINPSTLYRYLEGYALHQEPAGNLFVNNRYEPVRLISKQSDHFDTWMMENTPVFSDSVLMRISELGEVTKEEVNKSIVKEDQQYRLIVEYEFIGAAKLAQMHRESVIEEIAEELPIGYLVKESEYRYWQREKNSQFFLILLVIGIIYMICAILLESLKQPLAVVLMIPVSFVGVFLTFYLFDFSFDQGGFASFLLLSGIVVNASLYILNDFNNLSQRSTLSGQRQRLYVKAYNGKIQPIFLTVASTVLGLIPFVSEGQNEVFWFALAVGTMGGLIFSILALFIFLPAFLPLKSNKINNRDIKHYDT